MSHEQQQVLIRSRPDQPQAHHWIARQIERGRHHRCPALADGVTARRLRQRRQIVDRNRHRLRRLDPLQRHAVLLDVGRAQRRVATHDFTERPGERLDIERAGQTPPVRDVIRGELRQQLVQEPQPLLRKRERCRLPSADDVNREAGAGSTERSLDWWLVA